MHKVSQFSDGRTYPSYGVSLLQNYIFRLQEATILGDLTEVPVPTRFLFVLLGPFVSVTMFTYPIIKSSKIFLSVSLDFGNYWTDWVLHFKEAKQAICSVIFQIHLAKFFFFFFSNLLNKELLDAAAQSLVLF